VVERGTYTESQEKYSTKGVLILSYAPTSYYLLHIATHCSNLPTTYCKAAQRANNCTSSSLFPITTPYSHIPIPPHLFTSPHPHIPTSPPFPPIPVSYNVNMGFSGFSGFFGCFFFSEFRNFGAFFRSFFLVQQPALCLVWVGRSRVYAIRSA
jgi:hypothetical protein